MQNTSSFVRNARSQEFPAIGQLMVRVYSQLEGFPQQPEYFAMLENIGEVTARPHTELMVAVSAEGNIDGAVVYFSDMRSYGSGGSATAEKNASGFRLLAVAPEARGKGIGRRLTDACISKAREDKNEQLIIHSTEFMKVAWEMYERMGFRRSEDLDFMQGELPVFGFRLLLQ
ncbi:GNAT family N-acetyltransferase [Salinimicrobium catena]|uniref:GNAT family N-acetyltransferase n=1 Tax=Salinimicrobium catena TaxID=390640 RepID=UPI002FE433F5